MSLAEALFAVSEDRTEDSTGVIDYAGFTDVRNKLSRNPNLARYLTPVIFMKMPKNARGCINTDVFMRFLDMKIEYERLYLQLRKYDTEGSGILLETDIQTFITDSIPSLKGLERMEPDFIPFYAFGATKKFMFHLDPRKSGKVSIADLVTSPLTREFMELRHGSISSTNWFSPECSMTVYAQYLELNGDNNGMISPLELSKGNSRFILTNAAISAIFQEHLSFNGSLDYRGYLELVLALDNPETVASKKYLWKLLNGGRSIGWNELKYFIGSLVASLKLRTVSVVYQVEDLCAEFLDFLDVKENAKVEYSTIVSHPNGGHFLTRLIDANAFFMYDNRESLLLTAYSPTDLTTPE